MDSLCDTVRTCFDFEVGHTSESDTVGLTRLRVMVAVGALMFLLSVIGIALVRNSNQRMLFSDPFRKFLVALAVSGYGLMNGAIFSSQISAKGKQAEQQEDTWTDLFEKKSSIRFFMYVIVPLYPFFASFFLHISRRLVGARSGPPSGRANRVATNVYQDLTTPFGQVVLKGTAQIILIGMYVWGILGGRELDFGDLRTYVFVYLSTFLSMVYIYSEDKDTLPLDEFVVACFNEHIFAIPVGLMTPKFWSGLDAARRRGHLRMGPVPELPHWAPVEQNEVHLGVLILYLRMGLDVLINRVGAFYIIFGLSVQIGRSRNPIEFVLNVVAAYYAIELDDLEASKKKIFTIIQPTIQEAQDDSSKDSNHVVVAASQEVHPRAAEHEGDNDTLGAESA